MEISRGSGFLPVPYRSAGTLAAGVAGGASEDGRRPTPAEPVVPERQRPREASGKGGRRFELQRAGEGGRRQQGPVPAGIRQLEQVQSMIGQEFLRQGGRLDLFA